MAQHPSILPNERELFTRISQGDEAAFTQVFYYYEPRIFPFLVKLTDSKQLAEEIVQELFLSLWLKKESAAGIENPRAYIFRMAANKATNWIKKEAIKARHETNVVATLKDDYNTAEDTLAIKEIQEVVNKAVEELPPQQKIVYKLNRQEGLRNEEIAAQLNISEKTVKNHLTEALKTIRQHLQKEPGTSFTLLLLIMKINQH